MEDLPRTDFIGNTTIGGKTINCAVINPDHEMPTRVFIQREVVGLLTGNKKGGLKRYLSPKNLQPYLPEKFKNKELDDSTIRFRVPNGNIAQGFIAEDLIDFCKMYIDAEKDDKLLPIQQHLADQAWIIFTAFAKIGVIGIIDEATGYQEVRHRFALNRLLEKFIDEEARKWVKKFPDKFYELIFKLNNWEYTADAIKNRRPSIIGKWTNEIIYMRFPKGVLSKLKDLNPMTEKGYRKYKYHQFLTEVIGNRELEDYISNAIFLMEASSNWRNFKSLLARATKTPYQAGLFDD